MPYETLTPLDLVDSRKIVFTGYNQNQCPQLTRLTTYFDLRVLQLQPKAFSHISKRDVALAPVFVLSNLAYRQKLVTFSPPFSSLAELEQFSDSNNISILHELLSDESLTKV
jgi:hypothetical protein